VQVQKLPHVNEKGCAILATIDDGSLAETRYRNYEAMRRESSFNEMSYLQKRQKDKRFTKHIKSAMQQKKVSRIDRLLLAWQPWPTKRT